jgi:hypothetical protein
MAQQPPRDHADRIAKLEDRVRQLELRVRAHGGNKVYVVGGAITTAIYIPPIDMAVGAPDDTIPETREIVGFRGKLRVGTCATEWSLNGATITGSAQAIDTTWSTVLLDAPVPVSDADEVSVLLTAASDDASDLSLTVLLASRVN